MERYSPVLGLYLVDKSFRRVFVVWSVLLLVALGVALGFGGFSAKSPCTVW